MILSVLLPFKNSERYLPFCLASLSTQTFRDFELIAINDQSSDNSKKIIVDWLKKNQVKGKILNGFGKGIGSALKIGSLNCKGTFIARMDSDDICSFDRFYKQLSILKANPSIKLLGSNCRLIDFQNQEIGKITKPLSFKQIQKKIFFKNPFAHGSVMLEKNAFFQVGGYNESVEFVEDYELWFRMTEKFHARNLGEYLYFLRVHKQSDTAQNRISYYKRALATRWLALRNGHYPPKGYFFYPLLLIATYCICLKEKRFF